MQRNSHYSPNPKRTALVCVDIGARAAGDLG
jgi:hypothetical protein